MHYAEGMRLIRSQDLNAAITHFNHCHRYRADKQQYLYILALALDKAGNTKRAIELLKARSPSVEGRYELLQLGLALSQKMGLNGEFTYFRKELEKI